MTNKTFGDIFVLEDFQYLNSFFEELAQISCNQEELDMMKSHWSIIQRLAQAKHFKALSQGKFISIQIRQEDEAKDADDDADEKGAVFGRVLGHHGAGKAAVVKAEEVGCNAESCVKEGPGVVPFYPQPRRI